MNIHDTRKLYAAMRGQVPAYVNPSYIHLTGHSHVSRTITDHNVDDLALAGDLDTAGELAMVERNAGFKSFAW